MRGFMRLVLGDQESDVGYFTLRSNELIGIVSCSPTTQGAGTVALYEDDEDGREIVRVHSNQYWGQTIYGPFEHASKRIYWEITGTANHGDIYAWHGHRRETDHQF